MRFTKGQLDWAPRILGIALCCALAACSVNPSIIVFNNTGEALSVSVGGDVLQAKPGEVVEFVWSDHARPARIGGIDYEHLALGQVPPEYMKTGWFRATIRLQLEPGAMLYVVPVGAAMPTPLAVPQPPGWPITLRLVTASLTEPPTGG